jgi:PAS domain S-box-containing protein
MTDIVEGLLQMAASQMRAQVAFFARGISDGLGRITHLYASPDITIQPLVVGFDLALPITSETSDFAPFRVAPVTLRSGETGYVVTGRSAPGGSPSGATKSLRSIVALIASAIDQQDELAAQREAAERFRTIVDATAEGIVLRLGDGRIAAVNQSAADMLGVPAGELIGRVTLPIEVEGPDDASTSSSRNRLPGLIALHTGQPLTNVTISIRRPDGEQAWLLTNSRPLCRPGETAPYAVVTSCADITERKRTLAALEESEARYRSLSASSPVGIFHMNCEGAILYANRRAQEILGQSAEQVYGDNWAVHVFHEDREGVLGAWSGAIAAGGEFAAEFRFVRSTGDLRWVAMRTSPLSDPAGNLTGYVGTVEDIDDRKRAEETIRRSEERFRSVMQHSSDVITIFNGDRTRQYVSPSVEHILGYSLAEFLPMAQEQLTHPDDLPAINHAFEEQLRHPGMPVTTQFRVRHHDGSWRWMESVATNLLADPAVRGLVSNTRDVTARHKAEEALRASEERFRHAFELALAGMALTGPSGEFTWVNHALCQMLGFDEAELLATSFRAILHPDDRKRASEDVQQLFTGKLRSYQRERRFIHKDGHIVWGLLSTSVLYDGAGNPVEVIGQVQDITERMQMEAALRASDERFRSFISNSSDIIATLDESGIIQSISPAVQGVLGYSPDELVGRQNLELVHPDDRIQMALVFARCLRSPGLKRQVEIRFRHRDGTWRCLEIVAHALQKDPAVSAIVADARDITERKAAGEALEEANAQLRVLHQAKSDFVSLVSHEFRTPLTGIRGFSELIRDEDLSIDEIKEFAGDINADAQRLARLIDQLLDLERMQSGRMQLDLHRVDLNRIIRDVVQQFRATTRNHRITLDLADQLPQFDGDKDKLIQVVTNLMANAIKYSPDGGTVRISTWAENRSIFLSVSDEGVGIAESEFARIFERYARVESGTGRFVKGIGLGLPIARQIVDMHGGQIWVESELGQGSTFHVRLPVDPPTED